MIMSSFRLKTYFTRRFQHSVSILTNILAFFSSTSARSVWYRVQQNKQTKTTQQQTHSHLKKVLVSRFPVVSNEAIQELNSVAVNKLIWSFDPLQKTVNERSPPKLVPISPTWKIYLGKYILKQTAPKGLDKVLGIKFCAEVTKRNRHTNELESLKIMQSAIERPLKEKLCQGSLTTQKKSIAGLHRLHPQIPSP